MSQVYIDRDLSHWQSWSVQRQINLVNAGWNTSQFAWQIGPDSSGGNPGLVITTEGQIIATGVTGTDVEMFYDAGPNNKVNRIRAGSFKALSYGFPDAHNHLNIYLSPDDLMTGASASAELAAATGTIDYSATARRYGVIQHSGDWGANVGAAGTTYGYTISNISVIGDHGLVLRGTSPSDGFYTSDIALHAIRQAQVAGAMIKVGFIDTLSNYLVQQYVQYTPVNPDQVLQDMAKLGPFHYGVWENRSIFEDQPEATIQGYGDEADVFMALADSNEADVSERLANLYTSATITYQDAAGIKGLTTVTLPNAVLDRAGIRRSVTFDLGISKAEVAQVFGSFVLQILYAQGKSAGSVELPRRVRDHTGALFPSHWIKAGINRIHINDLPSRAGLTPAADKDSYRISRIENSVDSTSGEVVSRVELDSNPNLIETLQARLDQGNGIFG